MYSALRPTPRRIAALLGGALAGTVFFFQVQNQPVPQIEQSNTIISELDKASKETTGKIWLGEEESSSK